MPRGKAQDTAIAGAGVGCDVGYWIARISTCRVPHPSVLGQNRIQFPPRVIEHRYGFLHLLLITGAPNLGRGLS